MTHPLTIFREAHDLTLEQFAAQIGASKGMVWKWENGTIPRRRHAERILKATGGAVTPTDFVLNGTARGPAESGAAP
ncbi:hypothetical protein BH10PSE7_BH10PSE7_15180 [soil metagenome]